MNEQETLESGKSGLRLIRNEALQKSDWTQLADCKLAQAEKDAWATHRQALRDCIALVTSENLQGFELPSK
jgi:hypothetical protein